MRSRSRYGCLRSPSAIVIITLAAIVFMIAVYRNNWNWTGFSTKTLWDWLQLLIIPVVLAIAGFWLNQVQKDREQRATGERAQTEHEIVAEKQREDQFQSYLDHMSDLLLNHDLRTSEPESEVRNVARVLTTTILFQLDARRIGYVFAFLRESGLMSTKPNGNIVKLSQADLSKINLSRATLDRANLSEVGLDHANLRGAKLSGANLSEANLHHADLSGADLSGADLSGAKLSGATLDRANLSEADLEHAKLRGATLIGADLRGATLQAANLSGANLSGADLRRVADLDRAYLSGATLEGADLGDSRVNIDLKASAKEVTSLKLPNPDEKYARFHGLDRVHGPLRTFGGPLHLHCGVTYATDEETVMYIQRSKLVLIARLTLPVLILLGLIVAMLYLPSLALYISISNTRMLVVIGYVIITISILAMLFIIAYVIIDYIDDVFILTTKRVIDINRSFIFFDDQHISTEYGQIKDIQIYVGNPLYFALDVGKVIVQTPDIEPNIIMDSVKHPFAIQDIIFVFEDFMEKK